MRPADPQACETKSAVPSATRASAARSVAGSGGTPTREKGTFVRANNVRPTLRYFGGKWNRAIIGLNDSFDPNVTPVVLGEPSATDETPGAMIYPFKKMIGNQPADLNNTIMLVPHLFGLKGGPNPYSAKFDWDLALQDGAAYTNRPYSGNLGFVDTAMYLTVNHEVAPKEMAMAMTATAAIAIRMTRTTGPNSAITTTRFWTRFGHNKVLTNTELQRPQATAGAFTLPLRKATIAAHACSN